MVHPYMLARSLFLASSVQFLTQGLLSLPAPTNLSLPLQGKQSWIWDPGVLPHPVPALPITPLQNRSPDCQPPTALLSRPQFPLKLGMGSLGLCFFLPLPPAPWGCLPHTAPHCLCLCQDGTGCVIHCAATCFHDRSRQGTGQPPWTGGGSKRGSRWVKPEELSKASSNWDLQTLHQF